jgi:hypothetical protein
MRKGEIVLDNLSNRQRLALRELKEFREEEAKRERLEKLEAERPIREATETLSRNFGSLIQLERERERSYLVGNVPDPHRYIDDDFPALGPLTERKAEEFNAAQGRKFKEQFPEVYLGPELLAMLDDYVAKEGIPIYTANMLKRLIDRFEAAGLLPERPAEPEPEPEPVSEPERVAVPVVPDTFEGRDLLTGEMRTYTKWEVERMDSETYRKTFKLGRVLIPYPEAAF